EAVALRLLGQCQRVARRLRASGVEGRTVSVKIKYADFSSISRRVTLEEPTDDGRAIHQAACAQLARANLNRPIRLTGVSLSGLSSAGDRRGTQLDLFGAAGVAE